MVVERSAAGEVTRLVGQLNSHSRVAREAAVARLTILGARAVAYLLDAFEADNRPAVRAAILRILEAIGDRRALAPAIRLLEPDHPDVPVTLGAISIVRSHLDAARAVDADRSFEALTALALDRSRDARVRLAAIDALDALPLSTRQAILDTLATDPNPRVRRRAAPGPMGPDLSRAALEEAAEGTLPDAPVQLHELIAAHGAAVPLATLHRLVGTIRAREAEEAGGTRAAWQLVRAQVHQALAARQSKVALYDLRESIAGARDPLPSAFLAALSLIGDASCLEPVAAAFAGSRTAGQDRWRAGLAGVFQDIIQRERLSRRHAVVKRVLARWPNAAAHLLPPRR